MIDGDSEGITETDDRRIDREEWQRKVGDLVAAGDSWAPFVAFRNAKEDDFDVIDADGKGKILLIEFCQWAEKGEITAGTEFGQDLNFGDD